MLMDSIGVSVFRVLLKTVQKVSPETMLEGMNPEALEAALDKAFSTMDYETAEKVFLKCAKVVWTLRLNRALHPIESQDDSDTLMIYRAYCNGSHATLPPSTTCSPG